MMMMRVWREAAAAATARTDADAGGALPAEVDDFRGSVAQAAYPARPPAPSLPPSAPRSSLNPLRRPRSNSRDILARRPSHTQTRLEDAAAAVSET